LGDQPFPTLTVSWSPDSALLAVTMEGESFGQNQWSVAGEVNPAWRAQSEVYLWQAADGKLRARCVGHRAQVIGATFSPDNSRLLSFGIDDSMRLWDAKTGKQIALIRTEVGGAHNRQWARLGAFSIRPAALVTSEPGRILVRDPSSGEPRSGILTLSSPPCAAIAVSSRGEIAACSYDPIVANEQANELLMGRERSIRLYGKEPEIPKSRMWKEFLRATQVKTDQTGRLTLEPSVHGGRIVDDKYDYSGPTFSPDGKLLCVLRWAEDFVNELVIWDTATWKVLHVYREKRNRAGGSRLYAFAHIFTIFTADSRYLSRSPDAYWDMKTGDWKSPNPPVHGSRWAFSQDGQLLLTVEDVADTGTSGVVSLWEFKALQRTFVANPLERR
jgi:WD40 repeat protein